MKGYLGAPVKQLKRKAKPSAESTVVNEKNIGTFAVFFSVSQPFFVASLAFMKGTSCCVIRRNF